jgi:hydrogenase/urease accessory protein HupE
MKRCGLPAIAAALLMILSVAAKAHTGGTTGFAQISVHGQTVRYALTLTVDTFEHPGVERGLAAQLRSGDFSALPGVVADTVTVIADGQKCVPVPGNVTPPSAGRSNVLVVVHFACPQRVRVLSLRDNLFDTLGADHHTLATLEWPGGREQLMFQPDRPQAQIPLTGTAADGEAAAGSAQGGMLSFFLLGIEHILLGWDHLLFLVALALRGGRLLSLLAIVTAFTVAHSITLALAVLGVASFPSRLVEAVIALSIAYVALENIFRERAPSRRWAVSFLFGLVHGFGFAGALMEIGLPRETLVSSLLSFNLGVEAGQALVVALLLPALLSLDRLSWERRLVRGMSAALLVVAVVLLVERTFGPAG